MNTFYPFNVITISSMFNLTAKFSVTRGWLIFKLIATRQQHVGKGKSNYAVNTLSLSSLKWLELILCGRLPARSEILLYEPTRSRNIKDRLKMNAKIQIII